MLRLMIERFATYRSAIHGRLWIDGQYVCDTLENEPCCLQEGSYPLVINPHCSHPLCNSLISNIRIF